MEMPRSNPSNKFTRHSVWTWKCPVQTQATNSHTIPSEQGNAPFKHKQQIHTSFSLNTEMPRSKTSNKFTHHSVWTRKCPVQTQATNSHTIQSEHGNAPFKPKQQIYTPLSLNTEIPRSNPSNKFTHHSVWTWKCPVQTQATNSHTIRLNMEMPRSNPSNKFTHHSVWTWKYPVQTQATNSHAIQSQHGNALFKPKQPIHTPFSLNMEMPHSNPSNKFKHHPSEHGNTPFKPKQQIHTSLSLNMEIPCSNPSNKFTRHSVWTRKCPVQTQATNSHTIQSEHGNAPFKPKQQIHTPFSLNMEMPRSNPSNKFTHHPSEHGNTPFKPKQQIHTPLSLNMEMPRSNPSNKFIHHSVWTWKCPVQTQATNSHTTQSEYRNAPFKPKQQIHTPLSLNTEMPCSNPSNKFTHQSKSPILLSLQFFFPSKLEQITRLTLMGYNW